MKDRENIIEGYVLGYNNFDIEQMVKNFHEEIVFENISNGSSTHVIHGVDAFREQAAKAISYFTEREQTIKSFHHQGDETIVEIDYHAIPAEDLPNGIKKGEDLQFAGKSIFRFSGGIITNLTDIS